MGFLKRLYLGNPLLSCFLIICLSHLALVTFDTYTEDSFISTFYPGAVSWRGPYETLVWLGFWLAFGKSYSANSLWKVFIASSLFALLMVMDSLWLEFWGLFDITQFGSYVLRPQDGVMVLALVSGLALTIRGLVSGFTAQRAMHLMLMAVSSTFLIGFHILVVLEFGKTLEQRDLSALSVKATSEAFFQYCVMPGVGCYEGPYRKDGDYSITIARPLHPFVYSQFKGDVSQKRVGPSQPDNTQRLGGLAGLNEFAESKLVFMHAWNTGWLDASGIDQPEKQMAFYKKADRVRVIVDYHSAVDARNRQVAFMRPILAVFSFVWIIGGLCMTLKHQGFSRFRRMGKRQ